MISVPRRLASALASAGLAVVLAGCTSDPPAPDASPESTPATSATAPAAPAFEPPPVPRDYRVHPPCRFGYLLQADGWSTEAGGTCAPLGGRMRPVVLAPGTVFYVRSAGPRRATPALVPGRGGVVVLARHGRVVQYLAQRVGDVSLLSRGTRAYDVEVTRHPVPPRPPRRGLRSVGRIFNGLQVRPYSGPANPPARAREVLGQARKGHGRADSYLIGRIDVGVRHLRTGVQWHSVWVIGDETRYPNLDLLGDGPPQPFLLDHPPHPGWVRTLELVDVRTGTGLMGAAF